MNAVYLNNDDISENISFIILMFNFSSLITNDELESLSKEYSSISVMRMSILFLLVLIFGIVTIYLAFSFQKTITNSNIEEKDKVKLEDDLSFANDYITSVFVKFLLPLIISLKLTAFAGITISIAEISLKLRGKIFKVVSFLKKHDSLIELPSQWCI